MPSTPESGSVSPRDARDSLEISSATPIFSPHERVNIDNNKDTMTKSLREGEKVVIMAGAPMLPPPEFTLTVEMLPDNNLGGASIQATSAVSMARNTNPLVLSIKEIDWEHDEIMRVLDGWSDSLRDTAQRTRESIEKQWKMAQTQSQIADSDRQKKAAYDASFLDLDDFKSWMRSLPTAERLQMELDTSRLALWVSSDAILKGYALDAAAAAAISIAAVAPSSAPSQDFHDIPPPVLAAAIIISGKSAGNTIMTADTSGSNSAGVTPVEDNINLLMNTIPTPEEMRAQLAYLCGLFAHAAQYMAAAETLPKSGEDVQNKFIDKEFAERYAKILLALVNSSDFLAAAMVTLSRMTENHLPLTKARQLELIAMLKISLLAMALALAYRTEVGGNVSTMTAQEFMALLDGTMDLPEGDIKKEVAAAIRALMDEKNDAGKPMITPRNKKLLFNAILEYLESNPNVEELCSPVRVCVKLLDTESIRKQAPPVLG